MPAKSSRFFCDNCGTEVLKHANICPKCGRFFSSIKCPKCGFYGAASDFSDGCPKCGYSSKKTKPSKNESSQNGISHLVLGGILFFILVCSALLFFLDY
ncbi:MAG: zinc-ribbon domain-containing protein [Spirochaetaceae bacterium]|nr:zinc-ribbon domain-containing protein [Spirochaetaceae bacterium]